VSAASVHADLVAGRLAAVAAGTGVAALSFGAVFAGTGFLLPLLGAAALPAVVIGALAGRAIPPLRIAAALAALAGYVVLAVAPGRAVLHGPAQLLTGAVPLDPRGPALAAVVIWTGLAALASAELALRQRAGVRPALPAMVLLVTGLAVGASGTPLSRWLPAGVAASAGALLALRARPSSSRPVGQSAVAAAMVVAAAAVTATIGPSLPGASLRGERFDARDLVAPPVDPKSDVSPLVEFPAFAAADRPLFTATTDRPVGRFRLAALNRFDGRYWSAAATYRQAGQTLPPGDHADRADAEVRSDEVHASVTLQPEADLGWLPVPSPGRAAGVSVSGMGVDAGGDLAVPARGTLPAAYHLTVRVPRFTEAQLAGAVRPDGELAPVAYELPSDVQAATRAATAGADTAFGQLAGLASYFRRSRQFSVVTGSEAAGGHGLFQISRLLKDKHGTAEQYASAFAVMARSLGFDTRVVVGFRPQPDRGSSTHDTYDVTTGDVHAWPEVRFAGLGWVPFEPSPLNRRSPAGLAQSPDQAESVVDRAVEAETNRSKPPVPTHQPAPRLTAPPDAGTSPWARLLAALAVLLVLLVTVAAGFAGIVPLAKLARRQRRRRAADPAVRVIGAWDEVVDRLAERRLAAPATMTRGELVAAGRSHVGHAGAADLSRLARLSDAAGYARSGAQPADADTAWQLSIQLRQHLATGVPLPHRVRHAVNPRPLLRRRRG
jgi:transglutaminase-like putative cysteine protease